MMRFALLIALAYLTAGLAAAQDAVPLTPGMIITESTTIVPGHYRIPADSTGAIIIRGDGIVVDFGGAIVDGGEPGQAPDTFAGTGIRVESGTGIMIRNAVVRGYKLGLWATDTPGIHITRSDFSYNWRQRLKSIIEREHLDDWMSYHQNEQDEWMRYGAAIYLRRADGAQVDHVKVTGGQNGILMTEVNDGLFYNNEITFKCSLGIGMYRSSRNRVMHNRLDFNVRGYSHGVYNRGQDSAAILLYEQSNENRFAYNSATHSGDGFFLWAGQSTMDTGIGGCNDNLIYANDFSYAPTNGIEVTFSRNHIEKNVMRGCWHGIWGGYSYDTAIIDNIFEDNDEHIAIEHTQDVTIQGNHFKGGNLGVYAWSRAEQPADWGYSESRDVRSQDLVVSGNTFAGVGRPLQIRATDSVTVRNNTFRGFRDIEVVDGNAIEVGGNAFPEYEHAGDLPVGGSAGAWNDGLFGREREREFTVMPANPPMPMPDAQPVRMPEDAFQTREYILVDEWGPVDFRSPVLWPRSPRKQVEQEFELVGPSGSWRVVETSGVAWMSAEEGSVPGRLTLRRTEDDVVDIRIRLEYVGAEVTDRFGNVTAAGEPFVFGYDYFFVPIEWSVRMFNYTPETDPREQFEAFQALIAGEPVFEETTTDLGYQWYGEPAAGLGRDHFATVSTGSINVPAGRYRLDLTSDDGVRVWLDGQVIHDDWTYHPPKLEQIELELGGAHELRIEHFEINGFATIAATLERLE
jgi:hypothetical protein